MFEIWTGTVNSRGTFVPSYCVKSIRHKVEALAHAQQEATYWAARGWDIAVCEPGQNGTDESVVRCF